MLSKKFFAVIALIILSVSLSLSLAAQTKEDDEVIKVDTALVNVPFSVSDREGRSISGLSLQNFTLFEDGKAQKIEYLSTQDTPLNIVLLMDTSQSAQEIFDKIKNAAAEFIKQLRPADRCMVITFDEAARVKNEFTNNQKVLDGTIRKTALSQKPGTLMRDTINVTINKELAKIRGRKAIILITDGKDAGSAISKNDLLYRLAESDAPVYSVVYESARILFPNMAQNSPNTKPQTYQMSQKQIEQIKAEHQKKNIEAADFLGKVSEVTGGRIFRQEINNLAEAFNGIAEELRKQYLISFYPNDENYDISKHQIKIRVDKTNAVVRMKNYTLLK
ncbi:MAG: VWA domain-containing protein [Pyrinomonadaceae bacterium]|nr:VWA domain-containing protein [Pyrinomonadaceae bacterium]